MSTGLRKQSKAVHDFMINVMLQRNPLHGWLCVVYGGSSEVRCCLCCCFQTHAAAVAEHDASRLVLSAELQALKEEHAALHVQNQEAELATNALRFESEELGLRFQ